VLDIEESFFASMSKKQISDIIDAFSETMSAHGYTTTVYSNAYFFTNTADLRYIQSRYEIWVASWGDRERLNAYYDGKYRMWQYSSAGTVAGINGNVDLNYFYK
jgi:GH25 family lysozyme M1 (1,4-beta-N-acetylmuramidase)